MARIQRIFNRVLIIFGALLICGVFFVFDKYIWNPEVREKDRAAGILPVISNQPLSKQFKLVVYEQPLPPASLATKEQLKLAEKLAKEHLDLAKEEQLIPERNASNTEADEKCEFEATFEDNLRYIQSYQLDEAVPYVEKLQLYSDPVPSNMSHAQLQNLNFTTPIFVTALSSNHFQENLDMLENIDTVIRPVMGDIRIVVYDLGLNETERQKISEACRCIVKTFPFSDLPEHITVKGWTWKPIIIQFALKEHPFVIWMDSSIRFTTGNLTTMFEMAVTSGLVFLGPNSGRISRFTHSQTFDILREPKCLFRTRMFPATVLAVFAKDYILEGIVKPWVKCALIQRCLKTTEPYPILVNCANPICHRYDQSVINILIQRLFHDIVNKPGNPHIMFECEFLFVWRHNHRRFCRESEIKGTRARRAALPYVS